LYDPSLPPNAQFKFVNTLKHRQDVQTAAAQTPEFLNPAIIDPSRPIRDRLKLWQHEFGGPNEDDLRAFQNYQQRDEISNGMASHLSFGAKSDEDLRGSEFEDKVDEDGDDLITIGLFLKPGDVVEISYVWVTSVSAVPTLRTADKRTESQCLQFSFNSSTFGANSIL
jgi:hypothetical protein